MSIARQVAIVGVATLASRVLGFARDVAIAGLFGAGLRADAFVAAFQFTNLVRRLLTEGALNTAFVPLYLRRRDASEADAAAFAGQAVGTLTVGLLALAVLLALAMPVLMLALAPGFAGGPRLALAIELARLMLPYLVLAGPVAVLMGVLNANNRFAAAALAALVFNAAVMLALAAMFAWQTGNSDLSARILALSIAAAGLCQLALVGAAVRAGATKTTPLGMLARGDARRFAGRAVPGLIASGTPQLTMIAAVMIASDWPSAASWLYYAHRVVELPLGMVGIAIGTVMMPALAHGLRGTERDLVSRTIRHGIELSLGLALPAAIALIWLAWPIVRVLFERGAFTIADSNATAAMMGAFALGLPGHVLMKAFAAIFFAREDTRTPMLVGLVGLMAAAGGGTAFMLAGRPTGIALSIAASGWLGAALLWRLAARRSYILPGDIRWRRLAQIGAAAMAMGIVARTAAALIGIDDAGATSRLSYALALAAVIGFGLVFYLSCLWLFGILRSPGTRADDCG